MDAGPSSYNVNSVYFQEELYSATYTLPCLTYNKLSTFFALF